MGSASTPEAAGSADAHAARTATLRNSSLRGRAIEAALRMVEAEGTDAVNLRRLADEIGTGAASLYYHFANKEDLLAEIAAEGFRRLRDGFARALGEPRGRTPLHACGEAYLDFSRSHPRLYRLMYAERLLAAHPKVREAEAAAFGAFAAAISDGDAADAALADRAVALWAFGRGAAALSLASSDDQDRPSRDLARQAVRGLESLIGRSLRPRRPP